MSEKSLTDTNEKIVYKDHDILIAVHTLQQESLRRADEDRRASVERGNQITLELRAIAVEQARISTEVTNFKNDHTDLTKRLDNLEAKSTRMDIISYILASLAGVIAWFK